MTTESVFNPLQANGTQMAQIAPLPAAVDSRAGPWHLTMHKVRPIQVAQSWVLRFWLAAFTCSTPAATIAALIERSVAGVVRLVSN
jgi:hypothetical protein